MGDSFLLADPAATGSSLVCVTTNVNTACCRGSDNPENIINGGIMGEWLFPNRTMVPHHDKSEENFTRSGYTEQVRLNRRNGTTSPIGFYVCEVPDITGTIHSVSIGLDGKKIQLF